MAKPNFVRIASGQFLTELVDGVEFQSLEDITKEDYDNFSDEELREEILDLSKLLEDMYNTGVQVGVREATKRSLCDGS